MQEKVQIKNKKGLLLSAVIERPDDTGKYPTVLFLHGFKGYKEEATYTDLAQRFLEHGIASVCFDASGFGDSEGTLEDDYRFSNYIDDTEAVFTWLLKQDFADTNKLGVVGQSMGGAQTILFASNHPELKIAISISPPDKIGTDDALGAVKDQWKNMGYLQEMSSRYGKEIKIPYVYLEDAMQYDFAKLAANVQCPLVVVLGEKDDIVLPTQTERVFNAAKEPKILLRFENMDHFYKRDKKVLNEVGRKITNIIVEYLH
ncbi:MAG: alpha/beta fold hydrolase [Pseudomonadales bacterium]|nr:alpha/beta fold hydrolase [Candidatus Woesebacteria bacterium]MCB9800625.1 alpha/beta fold hydrolase [Pseudomonadales bacterium]